MLRDERELEREEDEEDEERRDEGDDEPYERAGLGDEWDGAPPE